MTRLAAVLVVLIPVPVRAQYAPRGGGFEVKFPGTPKESTQKTKSSVGELKVFTATYATTDGSTYLVSHTDFPAGSTKPEDRAALYDGARDALAGKDGKVLSDAAVEVGADKLPGRAVEVESGKRRMRFRFVLRGDRLYQVAVVGSAAFVGGKDAARFLDSFELTK